MGQRVDLDPRLAFGFKKVEIGAGAALIALAPGDPSVIARNRPLQWRGLAQGAAGVGVDLVQGGVGVFMGQQRGCRADGPHVGQPQLLRHLGLIGQSLGKQHHGIDEQHRGGGVHQ